MKKAEKEYQIFENRTEGSFLLAVYDSKEGKRTFLGFTHGIINWDNLCQLIENIDLGDNLDRLNPCYMDFKKETSQVIILPRYYEVRDVQH